MKTGRMTPATLSAAAAAMVLLLVTGCAKPFTADVLAQANDETPPVVTITSPENESYYAKTVAVSGTVSDSTGSSGVAGEVETVTYEIPAASVSETVSFDENGSFSFQFSTATYTGSTITVRVVASDRNGNETAISLTLLYGGSDIASFEAVPGNQEVTLQWEPVPGSGGYVVRNLGTSEEVALGSAASSHTWTDLDNGEQYFFQLESSDSLGQTNLSSEVTAIPLSPYTLMPRAESDADGVNLRWRAMPGVETYVVEKAENPDGPYLKRFVTSATTAEDTRLNRDTYYYYRVYPEGQEAVKSAPAEAVRLPYSETGTDLGDYFGPLDGVRSAVAYGNYFIVNGSPATGEYIARIIDASDPTSLTEVGSITFDASIIDLAVDPDLEILFVSLEEEGVAAVDISDTANPQLLTNTDTDGLQPHGELLGNGDDVYTFDGLGVVYDSSYTYVVGMGYEGAVYVARVATTSSTVTFTPTDSDVPVGSDADDMAVYGSSAYLAVSDAGGIGYDVIDLSTPGSTISRSQAYRVTTASGYTPDAIAANGDYVFIGYRPSGASSASTVRAVDRFFESRVADFDVAESVEDLSVADGVVYASLGTVGVEGFDVASTPSDGDAPVVVPDVAGSAQASLVMNGYLLVAGLTGVESFNLLPLIEKASTRVQIGSGYNSFYAFTSVGTRGHFIDVYNFYSADISAPTSLGGLSLVSGLSGGVDLILQGNRQLLASRTPGPDLITAISPPSASTPQELGSVDHNSSGFYSIGDVTYGFSGSTISVFDSSDSSTMTRLQSFAVSETLKKLVSRGDYLYAVYYDSDFNRDSGILVLDISDPLRPTEVAKVAATGLGADVAFHDIALFGDYLYLPYSYNAGGDSDGSDDTSGLVVYSVAGDPTEPTFQGAYVGDDVFSGDPETGWSWTKRFELVEVQGHLAAVSTGFSANGTGNIQVYEGRIVLLNVADPSNIYKIKDVLSEDGDPYSSGADFPRQISLWKGQYLFVMGRQELSVFEL